MQIASAAIQRVVEIAGREGNEVEVVSSDWDPKQIVFMSGPLTDRVREAVALQLPQLQHFKTDKTPHNPADEGYVDREADMVISFPVGGEDRRWY